MKNKFNLYHSLTTKIKKKKFSSIQTPNKDSIET